MARIGFGYDSHRYKAGRPLILGGLRIDHNLGLDGHSDADAVLHALTDAILGAIGAGDIGELFPDTDPGWKGADSSVFVLQALKLATERGYRIENCDITIITEQPKLKTHKGLMRKRLAEILSVSEQAVSVKAKTNEGMGWVGRGEGLAAMAVVLLERI